MMAGPETEEDLLFQIQCLVSDSLQVVSYKWLSRKFSISSNAVKRLLQQFAKQNENSEIEIVYAISGWTKEDPSSYAIQLVPKSKLEEAKDALKGTPSLHVYSVQRCLPTDPAQLWSADFVQAEQLFSESADINNCLRDNRFSAVMCPLIHREPTKKRTRLTAPPQPQPQPPDSNGGAVFPSSTVSGKKAVVPPLPPKNPGTNVKDATSGKKQTPPSISPITPQTESKDSLVSASTVKRKAPAAATGASGGGGSLASMWGKAPPKSKAPSPPKDLAVVKEPVAPVPAGDAEARIRAMEADASSEDDMASEFASMRRGQVSNVGGKRRRMIMDDDDSGAEGDELETIIRLGSPSSPEEKKPAVKATRDTLAREGDNTHIHEEPSKPKNEFHEVNVKSSKLDSNLETQCETKVKREAEGKPSPVVHVPDAQHGGSKRKKILKTRIDERGREVTEVVWETEEVEKENAEQEKGLAAKSSVASSKQTSVKPPTERPQAIQKPSTAPSKSAVSKVNSKTSGKSTSKPGKGQGNIMSFFKKT